MAVVDSAYLSRQHCRVLIYIGHMLFNSSVVHVAEPLRARNEAVIAVKRDVIKGEEGSELLASRPFSNTAPPMKVVKVLEMSKIVLAKMLDPYSVGELLGSHTTLYAGTHEVVEPQRYAAPPTEPGRELGTEFRRKRTEDTGIPASECDRPLLASLGIGARRTAVDVANDPEGPFKIDHSAW